MDLKSWAQQEKTNDSPEEEKREEDQGADAPEQEGADEEFTQMVRDNREAIEEAAAKANPEELTNFDEELPQESADAITDELSNLPDDFTEKLASVDEGAIIAATESVEADLEQVDASTLGAWLYRASQLA